MIIEIMVNLIFIPPQIVDYYEMGGTVYVFYDYSLLVNENYLTATSLCSSTIENCLLSELTNVKIFYTASATLTFLILIRIYHFFRLIYLFSFYTTAKAQKVCKLMGCKANIGFGLRSYLKINPLISLTINVIFLMVFFGLAAELFEYYNSYMLNLLSITLGPQATKVGVMHEFSNIYNTFWLIIVTMCTIGYGDIYPTTYFGRAIAVLACIFGTFILSLLVVFFNSIISFDEVEKQAYNQIIEETTSMLNLKKEAIKFILMLFKYNHLKKKNIKETAVYRFYLLYIEMRYAAKKFKFIRMYY
jgi:hypothetical protein